jgi:hypothetical protein
MPPPKKVSAVGYWLRFANGELLHARATSAQQKAAKKPLVA